MSNTRRVDNYIRRKYDRIQLVLPAGAREQVKALAQAEGKSLNRYVWEAIEQKSGLALTLGDGLPWIDYQNRK